MAIENSFGSKVFEGFDEDELKMFVKFCVTAITAPPSKANVDGVLAHILPMYADLNTKQVIEEMKTFVPLKVGCKLQLNFELQVYEHCWHIMDYLFVEACKGFVNQKLLDDLGRVCKGDIMFGLSDFLQMLHRGIYKLYHYKRSMIKVYRAAALFPLHCDHFGYFAEEVVIVVLNADHERRLRGHRFIGVQVLLHCLAFSRVGNHELVKSGILNSLHDKPPERPPYRIYKLAGECAEQYDAEKVQLEHLVLAVLSVKEDTLDYVYDRKHMKGLRDEKAEFKDVLGGNIFKLDSKPIADYGTLVQAILSGLELPDIRTKGTPQQEQVVVGEAEKAHQQGDEQGNLIIPREAVVCESPVSKISEQKYVPPHRRR